MASVHTKKHLAALEIFLKSKLKYKCNFYLNQKD